MSIFFIKIIALISMLLDHIDKVFHLSIHTFTFVGRIAFPLFAFCFAEGSRKTSNSTRRFQRLLIAAFLSEPCFNLAFDINHWMRLKQGVEMDCLFPDIGFHNVLFTFSIAYLFVIWKRRYHPHVLSQALIFIIVITLAEILNMDYGAWGVLLITVLHLCNSKKQSALLIFAWNTLFYLGYASWNGFSLMWWGGNLFYIFQWLSSCLCIPFILLYNGKPGRKRTLGFYVFYPMHLLCLVILRELIYSL